MSYDVLWIIFGGNRPRGIAEDTLLGISKGLVNAPLFVHFYWVVQVSSRGGSFVPD